MLSKSEFILNKDKTIYHLNLKPEQIASTIITVGDPERVHLVTKYFDTIEFKIQKREFHTQTGSYKGKRITVISTGIGTDNVDIVINELDALRNINFITRKPYVKPKQLDIIRIGTSGAIQPKFPLDSFVISEMAIGFDSLLHFYNSKKVQLPIITNMLVNHLDWSIDKGKPYVIECDKTLLEHMRSEQTIDGITITNAGFYGPQGRVLRLPLEDPDLNKKITSFRYELSKKITNLEMETAGIYGLAKLLGHRAISMNAILANRVSGSFSKKPEATIDALIQYTLEKIRTLEPGEMKTGNKI